MSTKMTIGKVLLKIASFTVKFLLIAIKVALVVISESEKPVCGRAEARARKERGTITPNEFYKAIKRH